MTAKPTVYIETTVPSFDHEVRTDPGSVHYRETTRRWWDARRDGFFPVTSAFTLNEIQAAPEFIRDGAMALMREVPVLPVPDGIEDVIATFLTHRVMPAGAHGDAAHLARYVMYGCEYLLTWNCRHLANARKTRHIEAVCRMIGLPPPLIVTPEALMEETP